MKPNNTKQLNSVRLRQPKIKEAIIEQLKRTPIIQVACERVGTSRATFYRWRAEDEKFRKAADEAMAEGEMFINDMSESQLISLIKEKNWAAISFWLRHHHPKYTNKVEVTGNLNVREEPLTPEQEELVKKALELAGLLENKQNQKNYERENFESTS